MMRSSDKASLSSLSVLFCETKEKTATWTHNLELRSLKIQFDQSPNKELIQKLMGQTT